MPARVEQDAPGLTRLLVGKGRAEGDALGSGSVGRKWVLGRHRMHDVVMGFDGGYDGSLTDLAVAHGWYDQAHFTRDLTALVGVPPSRYRRGA